MWQLAGMEAVLSLSLLFRIMFGAALAHQWNPTHISPVDRFIEGPADPA
ncbi:MAG: hypothetical protein KGI56_09450 [Acidobacteriota bacterium]|nr:hypothetical protein [Acidobacteriota bacterium]